MKLRFDNYRRPLEQTDLSAPIKSQLAALTTSQKEWTRLELVDVIDDDTGRTRFQLYLYPSGSGRLFDHDQTTSAGYVAQHGLEVDDLDLFDALQAAFEAFDGFEESVDFD